MVTGDRRQKKTAKWMDIYERRIRWSEMSKIWRQGGQSGMEAEE